MYVMSSMQRNEIWNEYMICKDIEKLKILCEMEEQVTEEEQLLRSQGIRLLTTDKIIGIIG